MADCLHARTAYVKNPEKTAGGELITSYACAAKTAEAEFLLSKREYAARTGRDVKENDIIAYQVRQSFKPGEVTPEEANRIGYELAEKLTKGNHAFIVCTHTDKRHIHNHIVFNSTSLDCTKKYANRLGSAKDIRYLSDELCREHGLSVIEQPHKRGKGSIYGKPKISNRAHLKSDIDEAILSARSFEDVLNKLFEKGYSVKVGKDISFIRSDMKRAVRLSSLGENYTEEAIKENISGRLLPSNKLGSIVDIPSVLESDKGEGYRRWAVRHNLQVMQDTMSRMNEMGAADIAKLKEIYANAKRKVSEQENILRSIDLRLGEIRAAKRQMLTYAKTKDIYRGYVSSGYSKSYLTEHEDEINRHRKAKEFFNLNGKFNAAELRNEYSLLIQRRKEVCDELHRMKQVMKELDIIKKNAESIIGADNKSPYQSGFL